MAERQVYPWIFIMLTLSSMTALEYCDDNLNICLFSQGYSPLKTFNESQVYCQQNNAILLEIYNQAYQDVVESAFVQWGDFKTAYSWLNLGYLNNSFYWLTSGKKADYFNWDGGKPSLNGLCSFIFNSKWISAGACEIGHSFICLRFNASSSKPAPVSLSTETTATKISITPGQITLIMTGVTSLPLRSQTSFKIVTETATTHDQRTISNISSFPTQNQRTINEISASPRLTDVNTSPFQSKTSFQETQEQTTTNNNNPLSTFAVEETVTTQEEITMSSTTSSPGITVPENVAIGLRARFTFMLILLMSGRVVV